MQMTEGEFSGVCTSLILLYILFYCFPKRFYHVCTHQQGIRVPKASVPCQPLIVSNVSYCAKLISGTWSLVILISVFQLLRNLSIFSNVYRAFLFPLLGGVFSTLLFFYYVFCLLINSQEFLCILYYQCFVNHMFTYILSHFVIYLFTLFTVFLMKRVS